MADPMKHMEDYLYDLMETSADDGLNEAFGNYLQTVQGLYTGMMSYYLPGTDGKYKALGHEGLNDLRERCQNVFTATKNYRAQAEADGEPGKAQTDRLELMDRFSDLIMKDFNVFSGTLNMEEKSLPEILAQSRGYEVDLSGKQTSRAGANLSSRIPLTFTDSNGKKLSGFFTENTYANIETDWKKLRDEIVADFPEGYVYDRAIDDFMAHPAFQSFLKGNPDPMWKVVDSVNGDNFGGSKMDRLVAEGAENRGDSKGIQEYLENLEMPVLLLDKIKDVCKGAESIYNKYNIFDKGAKIPRGSNINERNSAMSTVADLLGVPDLVARSVRMKVIQDGQVKTGVFMENAVGSDLNHLKKDDPMLQLDEKGLSTPGALKSLADLQVLDYICGNVDRHLGNMFYETRRGKNGMELVTVKGIDNDCSFGTVGAATTKGTMRMVGSSHMRVISEGMANKIQSLSPEMLFSALSDYHLSDEELEAAGARLQRVQKEIADGKLFFKGNTKPCPVPGFLCVVKDGQWEQLSLKNVSATEKNASGGEISMNYMAQIPYIAKQLQERRENGIGKGYVAPRFAEGRLLTETDLTAAQAHNQELDRLGKRLAEVNRGFFISSKEFNNVRDAYAETRRLAETAGPDMTPELKDALKASYETLLSRTQTYLDKKGKEEQAMGKGKTPSDTMKNRMAFARELKHFTEERIHGLEAEKEIGKKPEPRQQISLEDLQKANRPEDQKSRGSRRGSHGVEKKQEPKSLGKGSK